MKKFLLAVLMSPFAFYRHSQTHSGTIRNRGNFSFITVKKLNLLFCVAISLIFASCKVPLPPASSYVDYTDYSVFNDEGIYFDLLNSRRPAFDYVVLGELSIEMKSGAISNSTKEDVRKGIDPTTQNEMLSVRKNKSVHNSKTKTGSDSEVFYSKEDVMKEACKRIKKMGGNGIINITLEKNWNEYLLGYSLKGIVIKK